MTKDVQLIPALSDNYIYMLCWENQAIIVDPAEAAPVWKALNNRIQLHTILLTHHHADHVGGVEELKAQSGCQVIGPNDPRVPSIDKIVNEGDPCSIGPFNFQVFFLPGHTSSHIGFYEADEKILFCGDVLFSGGCGRLFEGTPEDMYTSFQKLALLDDQTRVYCGHEYTLINLNFALTIEPENKDLQQRLAEVKHLSELGTPTIPSSLRLEKAVNPFMRVHESSIHQSLKMEGTEDVQVFAKIRELRNIF